MHLIQFGRNIFPTISVLGFRLLRETVNKQVVENKTNCMVLDMQGIESWCISEDFALYQI